VNSVDASNSPRLYDLMRGGNIYLSLSDAIALAIENNLDVQMTRYQLPIAATDVLRAKGGGTLRGISTATIELPAGVGGPASPLITSPASGTTPSSAVPSSLFNLNLVTSASTTQSLAAESPLPSAAGPPIPQYDPIITGNLMWAHTTTLEADTLTTGSNVLTSNSTTVGLNLQQGFSTGTQYTLGFNSTSQNSNSVRNNFNPFTNGSLGLTVTQPLLRGFGIAVNRRYISMAKNDQKIAGLNFRQQLINVIYGISRLYYDLVALEQDLKVKEDTLKAAQSLHENTRGGVEEGTLAGVELTRADAQVASAQQDLANSEGLLMEQELVMKNVLTRRGGREPAVQSARIITTDTLSVPAKQEIPTLQDLLPQAMAQRPDLRQSVLELENSRIALKGTRNELLPELDLVGVVQNSGLSGQTNTLMSTATGSGTPGTPSTPADPSLMGGYGNFLSQILERRYPTYEIGIQLNLPVRNRVAQADVVRDELQLRTSQTRYLQLQNQAEVEVEDAIIELRKARAAYDAAARARTLQEESLSVEQARFEAGVSTAFFVIQYQSYVAQARSTEVVARGNYFKAIAALDRVVGRSLETNGVSANQAFDGRLQTTATPRK
jgi:outer membrane protein